MKRGGGACNEGKGEPGEVCFRIVRSDAFKPSFKGIRYSFIKRLCTCSYNISTLTISPHQVQQQAQRYNFKLSVAKNRITAVILHIDLPIFLVVCIIVAFTPPMGLLFSCFRRSHPPPLGPEIISHPYPLSVRPVSPAKTSAAKVSTHSTTLDARPQVRVRRRRQDSAGTSNGSSTPRGHVETEDVRVDGTARRVRRAMTEGSLRRAANEIGNGTEARDGGKETTGHTQTVRFRDSLIRPHSPQSIPDAAAIGDANTEPRTRSSSTSAASPAPTTTTRLSYPYPYTYLSHPQSPSLSETHSLQSSPPSPSQSPSRSPRIPGRQLRVDEIPFPLRGSTIRPRSPISPASSLMPLTASAEERGGSMTIRRREKLRKTHKVEGSWDLWREEDWDGYGLPRDGQGWGSRAGVGRTLPLSDLWRLHGDGRVEERDNDRLNGAADREERDRARELSGDTIVASPVKASAPLPV